MTVKTDSSTTSIRSLDDVEGIADPLERLRQLRTLDHQIRGTKKRLRSAKGEAIREARQSDPRPTWPTIGKTLGVSAQRAQQLAQP